MSQIRVRINGKEVPQVGESPVSLEMALPGGNQESDTSIVLQLSDEGLSFEFIDGRDGQTLGMHRQVVVSLGHLRDLALDRREIRLSLMENDDCAVRQEDITDMAGQMIAEAVLDQLQDADELGGVDTPEQYVTLMYFLARRAFSEPRPAQRILDLLSRLPKSSTFCHRSQSTAMWSRPKPLRSPWQCYLDGPR
ncbi:hypothetical protein [Cupriavidus sp. TMH.W2]|uniref:hypothetical protein n=1 Tax=Cupriavidus sp. TMH.W2 TaxID=3434465 RepID=UPI003D786455